MAGRRILYSAVLAGALLFQITNDNYLARFLLILCIALPILSLVMSLPGMVRCRVVLSARPAALSRGEKGEWTVGGESFAGLPLSRVSLRLTVRNGLTSERTVRRLKLTGVATHCPTQLLAPTGHCGVLELRADRVRVCDYLGLFTWRLPPPAPAALVCRPAAVQVEPPVIPEGRGVRSVPLGSGRRGAGETYELREYRPGDPMRDVHWKLSSKWDELIVRERSQDNTPLPLLTLDLWGRPERLDAVLDQLLGLSDALLRVQQSHAVLWLDGDGEPQFYPVTDTREQEVCLLALLKGEAGSKEPGCRLNDHLELLPEGAVFRIHIAPEGGDGHG